MRSGLRQLRHPGRPVGQEEEGLIQQIVELQERLAERRQDLGRMAQAMTDKDPTLGRMAL